MSAGDDDQVSDQRKKERKKERLYAIENSVFYRFVSFLVLYYSNMAVFLTK